jgi:hypothetical protein
MRVMVTGGTGLIGSELISSLMADGHAVTVLTRDPRAAAAQLPSRAKAVQWDGKTAAAWGPLLNEVEAVVNLAGASIAGKNPFLDRWTAAAKREMLDSRVNAGKALVEAFRVASNKPRVLIQASAVGYYGPRGAEEIDESTGPGNDFLAKICVAWEESVKPIEQMGVRVCTIRTGIVFSAGGGALPPQATPFRFFVGGPLGSGRQYQPWIHEEDQVAAIRFLINNDGARGAYNLSAPNPLTNAELSKAIGRALRRPSFMPAPGFAFRLLFGEKATILLDGQRAIPKRLQQAGFRWKYPEVEAALKDLLR